MTEQPILLMTHRSLEPLLCLLCMRSLRGLDMNIEMLCIRPLRNFLAAPLVQLRLTCDPCHLLFSFPSFPFFSRCVRQSISQPVVSE